MSSASSTPDGSDEFIRRCLGEPDRNVRKSANSCLAANAARDPKKPKWARVPTGSDTCPECIMLASRGFAYNSEGAARHSHPNCDCVVVASWDKGNPAVQGYDPDLYYDMWKNPKKYSTSPISGVSADIDPDLIAWAKQYPSEELWVQRADGKPFYKKGTPLLVPTTEEEDATFANGRAKHTHTTPIGGTFGEGDIWHTADTWLLEHKVEDVLGGRSFELIRTQKATKESARAFAKSYQEMSYSEYDMLLGEIYDANGGDATHHNSGPTRDEKIEAEKRLKPIQHEWLKKYAFNWGYDYHEVPRSD